MATRGRSWRSGAGDEVGSADRAARRWAAWRWAACLGALCLLSGCAIEGPRADENVDVAWEGEAVARSFDGASDAFIHVGGICSQRFVDDSDKGHGRLASWPDVVSVDAPVDQRHDMATAVADLVAVLDEHCRRGWCYLYGYSNGAAVVSKTLSVYDSERWNIVWALSAGGNEGGSELSGGLADIGSLLGISCELAAHIAPSDHRAGWNHNDTGGNSIYQLGGVDEWWFTGTFPDFFAGSANDGAVAVHSSAGLNDSYHVPDDDPWLCFDPETHWDQHEVAFSCSGVDRDHFAIKMAGIERLGG